LLEGREGERELLHLLERDAARLCLRAEHALLAFPDHDSRKQRIHADAVGAQLEGKRPG
jgi:hypothetical protein